MNTLDKDKEKKHLFFYCQNNLNLRFDYLWPRMLLK